MTLAPGSRCGPFVVDRCLDRAGGAELLAARHERSGRAVVVAIAGAARPGAPPLRALGHERGLLALGDGRPEALPPLVDLGVVGDRAWCALAVEDGGRFSARAPVGAASAAELVGEVSGALAVLRTVGITGSVARCPHAVRVDARGRPWIAAALLAATDGVARDDGAVLASLLRATLGEAASRDGSAVDPDVADVRRPAAPRAVAAVAAVALALLAVAVPVLATMLRADRRTALAGRIDALELAVERGESVVAPEAELDGLLEDAEDADAATARRARLVVALARLTADGPRDEASLRHGARRLADLVRPGGSVDAPAIEHAARVLRRHGRLHAAHIVLHGAQPRWPASGALAGDLARWLGDDDAAAPPIDAASLEALGAAPGLVGEQRAALFTRAAIAAMERGRLARAAELLERALAEGGSPDGARFPQEMREHLAEGAARAILEERWEEADRLARLHIRTSPPSAPGPELATVLALLEALEDHRDAFRSSGSPEDLRRFVLIHALLSRHSDQPDDAHRFRTRHRWIERGPVLELGREEAARPEAERDPARLVSLGWILETRKDYNAPRPAGEVEAIRAWVAAGAAVVGDDDVWFHALAADLLRQSGDAPGALPFAERAMVNWPALDLRARVALGPIALAETLQDLPIAADPGEQRARLARMVWLVDEAFRAEVEGDEWSQGIRQARAEPGWARQRSFSALGVLRSVIERLTGMGPPACCQADGDADVSVAEVLDLGLEFALDGLRRGQLLREAARHEIAHGRLEAALALLTRATEAVGLGVGLGPDDSWRIGRLLEVWIDHTGTLDALGRREPSLESLAICRRLAVAAGSNVDGRQLAEVRALGARLGAPPRAGD